MRRALSLSNWRWKNAVEVRFPFSSVPSGWRAYWTAPNPNRMNAQLCEQTEPLDEDVRQEHERNSRVDRAFHGSRRGRNDDDDEDESVEVGEVDLGFAMPVLIDSSPPPRPAMPADSANATILAFAGLIPIDCAAVSLPRSASR